MRLHDTARRAVVPFEPGPLVTMYSCGITPYDAAHLGHAAVYLYFDMLQRRLQDAGHETRCVRNVTDVDDDILRKARELGVHYLDLAAEEMARFDAEMGLLNLLPVYSEPRATSAISEILSLIGEALERGHAYESGGSVYFSVASFPEFGSVSGFDRARMLELAAEHGGRPDDPNKRDPLDFVLWQPSLPDEPAWESRWGPGRPGWHIECSALVLRELGETIDIHGGGRDLVFPHHECETAQSESVTGEQFVRLWFHVGLVGLGGTKMSKSLGNLVFVGDLCKEWDPPAVRLALLAHHYRADWDWRTDRDMPAAAARLALWRSAPAGDGSAALDAVRAALDDDLDTPRALPRGRRGGDGGEAGRGRGAPARHRAVAPSAGGRGDAGSVQYPWNTAGVCPDQEQWSGRARKGCTMPGVISVGLPDGSTRELAEGTTASELAQAIGSRLAKAAVVATVDGEEVDLTTVLPDGAKVAIVTADSDVGRSVLRHSTAHVMAQAVRRLWPGAKYAIGPVIDNGFYYDFELPDGARFSEDDLEQIDAEMRAIIKEDQPFVRHEHSPEEGLAIFGDQPFKEEIIRAVESGADEVDASGAVVTTYRNTDAFIDLCRGPHVPSTGRLGHFKLMRVAGAYWRGDEKREQLQRIYGTAWESEKALAAYLHQLEEAERRDHRRIGAELDLYSFPDEIGSGLAIFHPKGGTIRRLMEEHSRQRHVESGYDFVNSPHITKGALFEESGHLEWFAEGMFPPMELDGGAQYYLKPMNCPFHILVYRSRQRSYRELPMRLFEFGAVYRYELSGVLLGLTRVRGMTQDDAHIFCTGEQMDAELVRTLTFVLDLLRDYGLNDFYLELSTKPPGKAVGSDEEWEVATEALRRTALEMGLELVMDEGGGAFYGPKISVQTRDAIGRTWQMSTVQLDFQLPRRFGLEYVGADNARHRPIMIHRALFGSVERFMAVLIEHYAGALPTWLCPEQVRVIPVADAHLGYAQSVVDAAAAAGLRASVDASGENVGALVRRARLAKVPYVLVVGDEDFAGGSVGVNRRGWSARPEHGVALTDLLSEVTAEVERKGLPEDRAPAAAS